MSEPLSQDGRRGKLRTPLGENVLVLTRFDGSEALSEAFEFRIETLSEKGNINFKPALGNPLCITIGAADGAKRHFHGLLAEARWAGGRDELYVYQLVMRPWLWLLTLTSDCRIFSQKTPVDVVKQVFTDRGFIDFRSETKGSYPTLEYCVQYRETDFDFVSRLMEQYGIYYFFEHSEDAHTLVLADQKASHKANADLASVDFIPTSEAGRKEAQHLEDWVRGRFVESGDFKLNDYDYNKPSANLLVDSSKPGGYGHDKMEMYDYPGAYADRDVGTKLAQVEAEAAQSLDERRTGSGSALSLYPGGLATLANHPVGEENQEYLVVACSHYYDGQSYRSGDIGGGGDGYSGSFEFTPSSRQFRAELDMDRPYIAGVQSALVVGKSGEEIDVDEQGRICLQFYWDRKKLASRRVRVAQFWAGKARGSWFVPRIGDEVLVSYEDGDPDRPIVIGSVYNGTNEVNIKMPDHKAKSGILTKSTKNSSGYNFIQFDDTAGSEAVKLRAQKDLMFKALNNEQRDIGVDQTENIGGDETINVGQQKLPTFAQSSGGNFTLNAFKTITLNVGQKGSPLTQIVMDQKSITFNVGPSGTPTQIVMNAQGITLNSPTITLKGVATVTASAGLVKINS